MPKETGIIMSGNHPIKCLDGTKTMSRRTWGLEKINEDPDNWNFVYHELGTYYFEPKDKHCIAIMVKCPYGGVGDILIMRETWASENRYNDLKPSEIPDTAKIFYLASDVYDPFKMGIVRPSLFIPYKFSRGKFGITEIRAERLQEISRKDIRAEGIGLPPSPRFTPNEFSELHQEFANLWDSLNAKRGYSWDKNPWVFPISFKKVERIERSKGEH